MFRQIKRSILGLTILCSGIIGISAGVPVTHASICPGCASYVPYIYYSTYSETTSGGNFRAYGKVDISIRDTTRNRLIHSGYTWASKSGDISYQYTFNGCSFSRGSDTLSITAYDEGTGYFASTTGYTYCIF